MPFFFARIFGSTEGSVTAHAKAETKYLVGVESAFPVAFMYANPHHWRFVFKSGGTEVYRFDLYDASWDGIGAGDGEFEEVRDRWPATWTPGPGTYDVYLYAMDEDNNDAIGFTGPVGRFFVPAADRRLLRVGMERAGRRRHRVRSGESRRTGCGSQVRYGQQVHDHDREARTVSTRSPSILLPRRATTAGAPPIFRSRCSKLLPPTGRGSRSGTSSLT